MERTHHGDRVKLTQACHRLEQEHDDTASLHSLDGSCQEVGSDSLKVLKNEHAECPSQNLGRVLVVAVANVGDADKELERIGSIALFSHASLDVSFDLCFPLLAVGGESQVLFVAPEHIGTGRGARLREKKVKVHHLIPAMVTDQHKEGAMVRCHIITDQGGDAGVQLLPHHDDGTDSVDCQWLVDTFFLKKKREGNKVLLRKKN